MVKRGPGEIGTFLQRICPQPKRGKSREFNQRNWLALQGFLAVRLEPACVLLTREVKLGVPRLTRSRKGSS